MFKRRGFTDKLYFLNFIVVSIIGTFCIILTMFSGKLGISDMSALSALVQYAYTELAIHTGFIVWKAQRENIRKFNARINKSEKESEE